MKLNFLKKDSSNKADKARRKKIRSMFITAVFSILLGTYLLVAAGIYILSAVDVAHIDSGNLPSWVLVLIFILSSVLIGSLLTILMSRFVLNAVNIVAEGMSELSKGNFDVRIELAKNEESMQIADAFNNLAKELKSTEMLRSNFVNEYAHEIKTPIVSIKGFAELLKQDDLTDEQRKEYLDILIEETNRLTALSSNSLNLIKVENQNILTNVSEFNLSEQVRASILLLEKSWQEKNINFQIAFDEYDIKANEEMLKQVWINLIDNAIKFSDDGGTISIDISRENDDLVFKISNGGETIKEEDCQKIFDKFYRANQTQTDGHGIGLSIVKKIVELHSGCVSAKSCDGLTTFIVSLPINR